MKTPAFQSRARRQLCARLDSAAHSRARRNIRRDTEAIVALHALDNALADALLREAAQPPRDLVTHALTAMVKDGVFDAPGQEATYCSRHNLSTPANFCAACEQEAANARVPVRKPAPAVAEEGFLLCEKHGTRTKDACMQFCPACEVEAMDREAESAPGADLAWPVKIQTDPNDPWHAARENMEAFRSGMRRLAETLGVTKFVLHFEYPCPPSNYVPKIPPKHKRPKFSGETFGFKRTKEDVDLQIEVAKMGLAQAEFLLTAEGFVQPESAPLACADGGEGGAR